MSSGPDDGPDLANESGDKTRRMPPTGPDAGTRKARVGPSDPPPPADSFRPAREHHAPPLIPPTSAIPPPSGMPPTSAMPAPERQGHRDYDYDFQDGYSDRTDHYRDTSRSELPPPAGPAAAPGTSAAPRRKRRKWPIIALLLVLVLLVVADRVSVPIAESQMKAKAEVSLAELNTDPTTGAPPKVTDVRIGGVPFLTQVLFGKYKDMQLTVTGIPTPGPRISEVKARMQGVHVPFGDAIRDQVGAVPVDDVTADVIITYDDLNAYLATQDVKVTPVNDGREVHISGRFSVPLLGTQELSGTTRFEVQNNQLTLVPTEVAGFRLPGVSIPGIPLPISGLPFKLQIEKATTGKNGIAVRASAQDVVLPAAP